MREVWDAGCGRRTPPGWRLEEQLARELGAYLSVLSSEDPQPEAQVLYAWVQQTTQGSRLLRYALSALEKVGGCESREAEPTHTAIPRRLTPLETERLQGWPDNHTRYGIDEDGNEVELKDGPRYRMCGNGVTATVSEWIGMRIVAAEAEDSIAKDQPESHMAVAHGDD